MALKIGIFSCFYNFVALSEDTEHMINIYRNKYSFNANVIATKCACHSRYKVRDQKEICEWISFPFLDVLRGPFLYLAFLLDLIRGIIYYFTSIKYDIIHYQQVSGAFSFFSLIPLLVLPSSTKKFVLVHYLHSSQKRFPWLNKVYEYADLVGVHSQSTKNELLRLSNLSANDIKIIPLGVQIPEMTGKKRDKLVFLGVPIPEKGFLTALKALKLLKEQGKKQVLHVYGAYTEEEKANAMEYAKKYDVVDAVFWGGRLSDEELNQKLQEAMIFLVLHTYSHGGSSTLVHGMANGAPIIATNVGGMKETLDGGGITIPPNDPESLVNAINRMMNDEEFRKKCSEKSRERAETLLSWESVIDRQLQLLEKHSHS